MKKILLFAAAALVGACTPSGQLSGTVRVLGGDTSAITVTITGAQSRAVAPGEDGTWVADGLPDGVYLIEAVGPSTIEGRVAARAEVASGEGQAPELTLTGAGKVSGRVSSPTGVAGAEVFVTGIPVRQSVGEDGSFTLNQVPAGEQTLVAVRQGYEPAYAKVTVPFNGTLENQILALTEVAHGSGEISGRAYFFDKQTHAGITVRVEGTQLSAQTDAEGAYTLRGAPLGYVTLIAEAAGYEPSHQENVLSASGGTLRPSDLRLSFAARRFAGYVYDWVQSPTGKELLFVGMPDFDTSYYLYWVDLTGNEPPKKLHRYGDSGSGIQAFWRADGRRVAVRFGNAETLYAIDVDTAELFELTQKLFNSEIRLVAERLFYLERHDSGVAGLVVWDFGTKANQSLGVAEPLAPSCPPYWGQGRFEVSSDARVAWFSDATPFDEVRVWNGSSNVVSGMTEIDCLGFHGDGTQLLGLKVTGGYAVYNLSGATPNALVAPSGAATYEYPPFLFTGNDQHLWYVVTEGANPPALKAIPVTGASPAVTLQTGGFLYGTSSTYVAVQPGGDQLAVRPSLSEIKVVRANGTPLKTYTATGPGAGVPPMGFGPRGQSFVHVFGGDRIVRLADTQTHTAVALEPTYLLGSNLSSFLAFSPRDRAISYRAEGSGGSPRFRMYRVPGAGGIDLPFVGTGSPPLRWSANDNYVLVPEGSGDRIVHVDTGAAVNLNRSAFPLSYSGAVFTGDESRLYFSEESAYDGRILSASTQDGTPVHSADNDGNLYLSPISDSARVFLIDSSNVGQPRGLYTLSHP